MSRPARLPTGGGLLMSPQLWSTLQWGHAGVIVVSLEPLRLALGNAAKQHVAPARLVTRDATRPARAVTARWGPLSNV